MILSRFFLILLEIVFAEHGNNLIGNVAAICIRSAMENNCMQVIWCRLQNQRGHEWQIREISLMNREFPGNTEIRNEHRGLPLHHVP